MKTQRLRLTIAYDGRPFAGWQIQDSVKPTVQGCLEAALQDLCGRRIDVQGSGRTDAGVHALGQVAHADVPLLQGSLSHAERWAQAINVRLPEGVRVTASRAVAADFHARFWAIGKTYRYRIWNAPWLHPLELGRAWHVPYALDRARLRAAAEILLGRHDFAHFAANRGAGFEPRSTVRTLRRIKVGGHAPLLTLEFEGDGFLYRMVRLLTGALVRVASGRDDLSWLRGTLARELRKNHHQAVADGLYLVRVRHARPDRSTAVATPLTRDEGAPGE